MKLERTYNAKRNIVFGMINQVITIILPFLIRTVTLKTLGTEYLGLSNLFTSILTVLSISELGIGSAIVFCMYKPIANDDSDTICALLNLYKNIYRIIGLIILIIGLVLIPFLPYLINGDYPEDINITILYLIYLFNTSISYYLFAYYSALLNAFQRNDIISKTSSVLSIARYFIQIIILIIWKNYYLYVLISPLFTISTNIVNYYFAQKLYPQFSCKGRVSQQIISDLRIKVTGMVIYKVQALTRNSFDSIFISAFLGLTQTAIYSNYYYIMSSIIMILCIFTSSIISGVGNSIASESIDKNYTDMNKLNFIFMWGSGWCTICLLCLYQPFMQVWMGSEMMFNFSIVLLFCLYFYSLKLGDIRFVYHEAKGLWWENRYIAISETGCNIILNYLLGKYFGIYGILMATIITILLINFTFGSRIVFKYYFGMDRLREYFLRHAKYFFITCIIGIVTYIICGTIHGNVFLILVLRATICLIFPNILYVILYWKDKEFKRSIPWILRVFSANKINIINKIINHIERE